MDHAREYRATWRIDAHTSDSIRADLVDLGKRFGWIGKDTQQESARDTVLNQLSKEKSRTLLIYDNASDESAIYRFLPPGGAVHVIVTSNARSWRYARDTIPLEEWNDEIGGDYLVERLKWPDQREDAKAPQHPWRPAARPGAGGELLSTVCCKLRGI